MRAGVFLRAAPGPTQAFRICVPGRRQADVPGARCSSPAVAAVFDRFRQFDAWCRASSALLRDLPDAPTALAACCGFDLCYKYILVFWYFGFFTPVTSARVSRGSYCLDHCCARARPRLSCWVQCGDGVVVCATRALPQDDVARSHVFSALGSNVVEDAARAETGRAWCCRCCCCCCLRARAAAAPSGRLTPPRRRACSAPVPTRAGLPEPRFERAGVGLR